MPFKFSHIMIALVAAHDIHTQRKARKHAQLFLTAVEVYEEEQRIMQAKLEWACQKLDDHGIGVSEFELIMLNSGLN